jgi:hypothetical protein
MVPDEMPPEQEFVPVKLPLSDEPDTVPCPVTEAEQVVYAPSNPPAGTETVKVMPLPDTVPDTVPEPFAPLLESVMVSVPVNDEPDCDSVHVISPGPDESVAVPDHDPPTDAGFVVDGDVVDGVVGDEPPPPPHPTAMKAAQRETPARTAENRVRIMGKLARILARLSSIDWRRYPQI